MAPSRSIDHLRARELNHLPAPLAPVLVHTEMSLDPSENPKCKHCGTMDVDNQLRTFFGVFVCAKDKAEHPDEYSLLTKTECKEDYLLTECECLTALPSLPPREADAHKDRWSSPHPQPSSRTKRLCRTCFDRILTDRPTPT